MRETCFRELYSLCLILWCLTGFYSQAECYPLLDCGDDGDVTQGSAVQNSLCGLVWGDQNKEQIQNVFKRFLFHYSKARNSVGTVERETLKMTCGRSYRSNRGLRDPTGWSGGW